MLSPLSLPNKKATPEQQLALMRNYINQLKDDAEAENYNITWEKLAKPLKEKIEGLDRDLVNLSDTTGVILANYVGVYYLEANYITAAQIAANYVATNFLEANYITAAQIAAAYVATNYLEANYITASQIAAAYVTTNYLTTNYLTANAISTTYLKSSLVDATYIAGKFTAGNSAYFQLINARYISTSYDVSAGRFLTDYNGAKRAFEPTAVLIPGYAVLAWRITG